MPYKEHLLTPLFEKFLRDMRTGKRLSRQGTRIRPETIENYRYTLRYLELYEQTYSKPIRIRTVAKLNQRELIAEKKYWQKFYLDFTGLAYKNGCYDNYVGRLVKNIKVFFGYLGQELCLDVGNFHKDFYVVSEDIDITILTPERLRYLIYDKGFEQSLPENLRSMKHFFVFGCTVALRFSDLNALRWSQIVAINGNRYLVVRSQKTDTPTKVKLPDYLMEILDQYRKTKGRGDRIFPRVSLAWFDKSIKRIIELAGWTEEVGKFRKIRGIRKNIKLPAGKAYRFCDLATSHLMRRTAITTMLMHGMPESVIKQISGHAGDSHSFIRYVSLVQPYLDAQIDRHFERMQQQ